MKLQQSLLLTAKSTSLLAPGSLISLFASEVLAGLEKAGIQLYLHRDFGRYMAVNQANRASWFPPMPLFNPTKSRLDKAFWIEGRNDAGETVLAQAERGYDIKWGGVARAIETLSLFYHDPASAPADERCRCAAPSARLLRGRVGYNGGFWVRPDYRKRMFELDLAATIPRLSRALGQHFWQTDYTISFVEGWLVEKGVVARYGYRNVEPGISWLGSEEEGDLELYFIWMTRAELLSDLAAYLAKADRDPAALERRKAGRAHR